MNIVNCNEKNEQHHYGLWATNEDKTKCYRTCEKCGFQRILAPTDEILHEIKMQEEAFLFFKAFQQIDKNDEYAIGYLNIILDDYINYLGKKNLTILINKMKEIEQSDNISMQNSIFLNYLQSYISLNNMEAFEDTLAQLQNYNKDLFESILTPETSRRHQH